MADGNKIKNNFIFHDNIDKPSTGNIYDADSNEILRVYFICDNEDGCFYGNFEESPDGEHWYHMHAVTGGGNTHNYFDLSGINYFRVNIWKINDCHLTVWGTK